MSRRHGQPAPSHLTASLTSRSLSLSAHQATVGSLPQKHKPSMQQAPVAVVKDAAAVLSSSDNRTVLDLKSPWELEADVSCSHVAYNKTCTLTQQQPAQKQSQSLVPAHTCSTDVADFILD